MGFSSSKILRAGAAFCQLAFLFSFAHPAAGALPRHPSQLYQMGLEGFTLFALLWWHARRPRPLGELSALFLIGYGSLRFIAEWFREPDDFLGLLMTQAAFVRHTDSMMNSTKAGVVGISAQASAHFDFSAKSSDQRSPNVPVKVIGSVLIALHSAPIEPRRLAGTTDFESVEHYT